MALHTSREYERELQALRTSLIDMAKHVEEMIDCAIVAAEIGDVARAHATIERDRQVNQMEVTLDEQCLVLLAKRQPMATDLRLIAVVLKMVTDVERMGDLAVNICDRVLLLQEAPVTKLPGDIRVMGQIVRQMTHSAISAFMNESPEEAEKVLRMDDEVDELYHTTLRHILRNMGNAEAPMEPLLYWQSVAKWLERIGDHCTNMAELIVFLLRGTDIRHNSIAADPF